MVTAVAGGVPGPFLWWTAHTVGAAGNALIVLWGDVENASTLPDWTEVMDARVLLLANVLLFALYAAVMLVNARIIGGTKGAMWFAGANLCSGAAMLATGSLWLHVGPPGLSYALTGLFSVTGLMMLHRSFADLLERGPMLKGVQYSLVAALTAGVVMVVLHPVETPLLEILLYLTLAMQFGVIAAVVFRFSGDDVGLAGWLTGVALSVYAVVQFMRALVLTHFGRPEYQALLQKTNILWLIACLVTSAATAFGYMFLATAKLRVELQWRAQVDELTGLLNRWALKRVAIREIERCRRTKGKLAVLMIDLDGMKEINDRAGHGCGDVVLQSVASVVQETVRGHDSVARMGGDEFCVLLPDAELAEAQVVAERLRAEVEELVIRYRGATLQVSASVGVASSDQCGLTWQSLLDHSDAALYEAKRGGKNQVMVAEPVMEMHRECIAELGVVLEERRRP
ncbi:diguanylate cyclase (GGDEF)-like protein [Edaphobacter aggregans]|uniref:diguanylate cyclase n=1 Tax=Edaphobacter aggregans TaxID=570835 RepID=A0A428MG27_9BACT|nr:GGDEF domain-containing protein [Edaphobacter aggregans]RSL15827.1 diguanylate cyclase (GGDEF)-like protein [Edaphobacter aggregans]